MALGWFKLLEEKITKQKKIFIDESDISCFVYKNIYTSLISIQCSILELFSKDEIKLILEPFVFNQFKEIGMAILGIINYGLYSLDKVKHHKRLLRHYDYKIKSESFSKKKCYVFEKKADESEYYFQIAKDEAKKVAKQINAIVPDVYLLHEKIMNYITKDKFNSESLTNISILIKDNNKRILRVFVEKLIGKKSNVNDLLTEFNLNPKTVARTVNSDFVDTLKLNTALITFVFLPTILSSRLIFNKQKHLKKSFNALLKLLHKLCKISDIDSNANDLSQNLFGLLVTYFVSDKAKQKIISNIDEVKFNNLSDNMIAEFCLENLKVINLKSQSYFDRGIYIKFFCIYKDELEKH